MDVRRYEAGDEQSWLRCRVLAFLDTAYFDDVATSKPTYGRPAVELVASRDDMIAGVVDVELDREPGDVCSDPTRRGGAIWTIAVHPDHRRRGIGRALLAAAIEGSREHGAVFLEAWARDDQWVRLWYEASGFRPTARYTHVYLAEGELPGRVTAVDRHLHIVSAFAHHTGPADALPTVRRSHDCVCYVLDLA